MMIGFLVYFRIFWVTETTIFCIGRNQERSSAHARFAGNACCDDYNVGICGQRVIVSASQACGISVNGVCCQMSRAFPLARLPLMSIKTTSFTTSAWREHICTGGAYISGAHYSNFVVPIR